MTTSNKEIMELLVSAGVGPRYRNKELKNADFPLAEKVIEKMRSVPLRPALIVSAAPAALMDTAFISARYMAFPLRRPVYVLPCASLQQYLAGREIGPMSGRDEEMIDYAKHVFLLNFCPDAVPDTHAHRGVEEFIQERYYRYGQLFHLCSNVPLDNMIRYSETFRSWVKDTYDIFQ